MSDMGSVVEWLEIAMRVLSAVVMTLAAVLIATRLHLCSLRPTYVWRYVGLVVGFAAIWRWTVVLLLVEEQVSGLRDFLLPLISPLSSSAFILLGLAFMVLTFASGRKRAGDG